MLFRSVGIALEAASKLKEEGIKTRVVSLPSWSAFDRQEESYRLSVLRSGAPILSVEALSVRFVFVPPVDRGADSFV